jgi:hypothetical protein
MSSLFGAGRVVMGITLVDTSPAEGGSPDLLLIEE